MLLKCVMSTYKKSILASSLYVFFFFIWEHICSTQGLFWEGSGAKRDAGNHTHVDHAEEMPYPLC